MTDLRKTNYDVPAYSNSNLNSKDISTIAYILQEMLEQLPKYSIQLKLDGWLSNPNPNSNRSVQAYSLPLSHLQDSLL
jgi:hypothetical protein